MGNPAFSPSLTVMLSDGVGSFSTKTSSSIHPTPARRIPWWTYSGFGMPFFGKVGDCARPAQRSAGASVWSAAAQGGDLKKLADEQVDTLISGEGQHWICAMAEELGLNVLDGGHYATETFGVKILAAHLSTRFKVPWIFLDHPTACSPDSLPIADWLSAFGRPLCHKPPTLVCGLAREALPGQSESERGRRLVSRPAPSAWKTTRWSGAGRPPRASA